MTRQIKIISTMTFAPSQSIILSTKLVFSKWPYILLAGCVTTSFWIIFNVFDQLLFFSPVMIFYMPEDAAQRFILLTITAFLVGAVISMKSMNPYLIRQSKGLKTVMLSLFSG